MKKKEIKAKALTFLSNQDENSKDEWYGTHRELCAEGILRLLKVLNIEVTQEELNALGISDV